MGKGQKLKNIKNNDRRGTKKSKNGLKMAILGHFGRIFIRSRQKSSKFDENDRFFVENIRNYVAQVGKMVLRANSTD